MNLENIKCEFAILGFKVIHVPQSKETNGPDLWVQKHNSRPLSVEIKKARGQKNGCFQVDPISGPRKLDDLICIECNSEYVLIEPMADHLKCCSPKGTRNLTLLFGKNP